MSIVDTRNIKQKKTVSGNKTQRNAHLVKAKQIRRKGGEGSFIDALSPVCVWENNAMESSDTNRLGGASETNESLIYSDTITLTIISEIWSHTHKNRPF